MTCASCPFIVRHTLAAVPGVREVAVSLEQHQATVTYDDTATTIAALTDAARKAGYPSHPVRP
jgi:periplasmic mercuric ion binding protein